MYHKDYYDLSRINGFGGVFVCKNCHQNFYITRGAIRSRNKCLCDECYYNKKPIKTKKPNKTAPPKPVTTIEITILPKYKRIRIANVGKKYNRIKVKRYKYKKKIIKTPKVQKKPQKSSKLAYYIKLKREELIQIRGQRCEICGVDIKNSSKIHMHHKNRNRADNSDGNLILLCVKCHAEEHRDNKWVYNILSASV